VIRIGGIVVGAATALALLGVAILPFLSPPWISFAQDRADATGWTGWPRSDVRAATDAIVGDLISGAGDFAVEVGGSPVLNDRERAHMRDVRGVFAGFYVAAGLAAVVIAVALVRSRGAASTWRAVRRGAIGLVGALAVGAVIVAVAFDAAFAIFHEIFFAAGSWTFDPRTDRLVQLFPDQFWTETTLAVGALAILLALGLARFAGRRA
jgi:integral membrane protein (TIGR01906 family)